MLAFSCDLSKRATGATHSFFCLSVSELPEGANAGLARASSPPLPCNRKCGRGRLFHKVIIRDQQVAERAARTAERERERQSSNSLTDLASLEQEEGKKTVASPAGCLLRLPTPRRGRPFITDVAA